MRRRRRGRRRSSSRRRRRRRRREDEKQELLDEYEGLLGCLSFAMCYFFSTRRRVSYGPGIPQEGPIV
eukprot:2264028-Pyramimonas_sp.AAC.1